MRKARDLSFNLSFFKVLKNVIEMIFLHDPNEAMRPISRQIFIQYVHILPCFAINICILERGYLNAKNVEKHPSYLTYLANLSHLIYWISILSWQWMSNPSFLILLKWSVLILHWNFDKLFLITLLSTLKKLRLKDKSLAFLMQ